VRYFMLHEMPFAQDGMFTYELMISRINSDLANILGNLISRSAAMVRQNFGGAVPAPGSAEAVDNELRAVAENTAKAVSDCMDGLRVADALDAIWALARRSNKYIDETAPWLLAKDESRKERLGTVLYNLIESIRILSGLIAPFLPETAEKIRAQIGARDEGWEALTAFGRTKPGTPVGEAAPLFMRIDEKKKLAEIEADLDAKQKAASQSKPAEKKNEPAAAAHQQAPEGVAVIGIEDFARIELKAAKIIACEPVEKADKLLKLTLDAGEAEPRQVVSGIAKWYTPQDLTGRMVIIVANLKPAKLRGVLSQGMILAADNGPDDVRVLFADGVRPGAKIR